MIKIPDYDTNLITQWFYEMHPIAPGLVVSFAPEACRLMTWPEFLPIANLFDALVRYGNRKVLKHFVMSDVENFSEARLTELVELTLQKGEVSPADRGKMLRAPHDILVNLIDGMDEQNHLYLIYERAYHRFVHVAAHYGLYLRGERARQRHARGSVLCHETPYGPSHQRPTHGLRLVASNGKKLP